VNPDLTANAGIPSSAPGNDAGCHILPIPPNILPGRIVKQHEARPPPMVIFIDDHVEPGRGALISLVKFLPRLAAEDDRITMDQATILVEMQRAAHFVDHDEGWLLTCPGEDGVAIDSQWNGSCGRRGSRRRRKVKRSPGRASRKQDSEAGQ